LSRPHEDRKRHTLVDHRPGGLPVTFPNGSWLVIGVAHVKAERSDACVAAYETLVEKARTSNVHAGSAVVMTSHNGRRVVTMVGVRGHDGFRHLAAAWDDHHRFAEHRAIAESVSLALYEVAASAGDTVLDPASHDTFVYEQFERSVPGIVDVYAASDALPDFRGAMILRGDDGRSTVVISHFVNSESYAAFRTSRAVANAVGSEDETGTTSFSVHPARTFRAPQTVT
jgi:hypothetical protein